MHFSSLYHIHELFPYIVLLFADYKHDFYWSRILGLWWQAGVQWPWQLSLWPLCSPHYCGLFDVCYHILWMCWSFKGKQDIVKSCEYIQVNLQQEMCQFWIQSVISEVLYSLWFYENLSHLTLWCALSPQFFGTLTTIFVLELVTGFVAFFFVDKVCHDITSKQLSTFFFNKIVLILLAPTLTV